MVSLKQQALVSIQKLPDTASVEDIMESVIIAGKVYTALAELDSGQAIPHAEIQQMTSQWTGK
jgi:hypothetical protein